MNNPPRPDPNPPLPNKGATGRAEAPNSMLLPGRELRPRLRPRLWNYKAGRWHYTIDSAGGSKSPTRWNIRTDIDTSTKRSCKGTISYVWNVKASVLYWSRGVVFWILRRTRLSKFLFLFWWGFFSVFFRKNETDFGFIKAGPTRTPSITICSPLIFVLATHTHRVLLHTNTTWFFNSLPIHPGFWFCCSYTYTLSYQMRF